MSKYINTETGEVLLSRSDMLKQFRDEYDGEDPTNILSVEDIYEEIGDYRCEVCDHIQVLRVHHVQKANGLCQCVKCGNWNSLRRVS